MTQIEIDLPDELHDAFREVLLKVPEQESIGELIALCFRAGVVAASRRAANICIGVNNYDNPMTAQDCADAIMAEMAEEGEHG